MTTPTLELAIRRLQVLKDFDDNVIEQLIGRLTAYTAQEHATLAGIAGEVQTQTGQRDDVDGAWLAGLIEDDRRFLEMTQKLVYELAIVALCKKVEICTKQATLAAYPEAADRASSKLDKCHKFLHKRGVDVTALPNYAAVDELRCLKHDLKNGGTAGKKLAAFGEWQKGDELDDLEAAYTRLAPLCASYVKELAEALIGRLQSAPSATESDDFDLDDED